MEFIATEFFFFFFWLLTQHFATTKCGKQSCMRLVLSSTFSLHLQEARSKFYVETEPEGAVSIEPLDGSLDLEGSCNIHFKRSSPSASMGRIYCKVQFATKVCIPVHN